MKEEKEFRNPAGLLRSFTLEYQNAQERAGHPAQSEIIMGGQTLTIRLDADVSHQGKNINQAQSH